jgi:hypothetical protein
MVRKDSYQPSVTETVFWIMRFFSLCVSVCVCVYVCVCWACFLLVKMQAITYGRILWLFLAFYWMWLQAARHTDCGIISHFIFQIHPRVNCQGARAHYTT